MANSARKTGSRILKGSKREIAKLTTAKRAVRRSDRPAKSTRQKANGSATASKVVGFGRPKTRQAHVLAMLCGSSGTTIKAVMSATGWQAHSVRGFFAGVVRKKLGLSLTSEAKEDGRVYRVSGDATHSAPASSKNSIAA